MSDQSVTSLSAGLSALGGANVYGFDLPTLQTQFKDNYSQLQTAESGINGYQAKRYDEEYSKANLGQLKDEISALDTQISGEKQTRDNSMSKTRKNPGYSAATITGETAEIDKQANSKISNLIDERNAKAGDYNAQLGEITKRVSMETADKQSEVESLRYNTQFLGGLIDTYQKIQANELSAQTDDARWEKEFELKLYDSQTSRTGTTKKSNMEQVKDAWGNVVGYFDPETGQTNYYQQSQSSDQQQQSTISEGQLRKNIRSGWTQGYTPDQMKQSLQGIKTDKGQDASSIIDDEWKIKTAPGVKGFLGRLFRLGV